MASDKQAKLESVKQLLASVTQKFEKGCSLDDLKALVQEAAQAITAWRTFLGTDQSDDALRIWYATLGRYVKALPIENLVTFSCSQGSVLVKLPTDLQLTSPKPEQQQQQQQQQRERGPLDAPDGYIFAFDDAAGGDHANDQYDDHAGLDAAAVTDGALATGMFYLHSGNVPEPGNGPSFQADHFASIVDGSSSGSQNKGKAIRSSALLSTQSCGTRGKIFAAEGVHNPSVAAAAESGVQAHLLTTSSAASAAAARPGPSSSTQSRMGFLDVGRDKATARLADISPAAAAPADFVAAYQAVAAMQAPSLSEAEQRAAGQADGFMAWAIGTAVQDCSEVDGVPLIELLRATAKDNPGFLPFAARVGAAAVVTKLFTGDDSREDFERFYGGRLPDVSLKQLVIAGPVHVSCNSKHGRFYTLSGEKDLAEGWVKCGCAGCMLGLHTRRRRTMYDFKTHSRAAKGTDWRKLIRHESSESSEVLRHWWPANMEAEFNKARQMAVKKAAERDVLQEADAAAGAAGPAGGNRQGSSHHAGAAGGAEDAIIPDSQEEEEEEEDGSSGAADDAGAGAAAGGFGHPGEEDSSDHASAGAAAEDAGAVRVSGEQLRTFVANLREQGLELCDVSSEGMSCLVRSVMAQVPGSSTSSSQHVRQLVAKKLEQRLEQEGQQGVLAVAIRGLYDRLDGSSTEQQQQQALDQHLTGVRGAAMLSEPDMAALAAVVQELHDIQLYLYSPTFAAPTHRNIYSASTTSNIVVRIAHVDDGWMKAFEANAQQPEDCSLNHFVVVRPIQAEDEDGAGDAAGEPGGRQDSSHRAAAGATGAAAAAAAAAVAAAEAAAAVAAEAAVKAAAGTGDHGTGAAAASQQSSHQQHLQQQVQELQQQLQKLQQQQQAPVRVCLQQQVQELQQQLQELQQALARVRLHGNRLQVTGLKSPGGGGGGWYHAPSGDAAAAAGPTGPNPGGSHHHAGAARAAGAAATAGGRGDMSSSWTMPQGQRGSHGGYGEQLDDRDAGHIPGAAAAGGGYGWYDAQDGYGGHRGYDAPHRYDRDYYGPPGRRGGYDTQDGYGGHRGYDAPHRYDRDYYGPPGRRGGYDTQDGYGGHHCGYDAPHRYDRDYDGPPGRRGVPLPGAGQYGPAGQRPPGRGDWRGDRDQYYRGEGERMGYGDARGAGAAAAAAAAATGGGGSSFRTGPRAPSGAAAAAGGGGGRSSRTWPHELQGPAAAAAATGGGGSSFRTGPRAPSGDAAGAAGRPTGSNRQGSSHYAEPAGGAGTTAGAGAAGAAAAGPAAAGAAPGAAAGGDGLGGPVAAEEQPLTKTARRRAARYANMSAEEQAKFKQGKRAKNKANKAAKNAAAAAAQNDEAAADQG